MAVSRSASGLCVALLVAGCQGAPELPGDEVGGAVGTPGTGGAIGTGGAGLSRDAGSTPVTDGPGSGGTSGSGGRPGGADAALPPDMPPAPPPPAEIALEAIA